MWKSFSYRYVCIQIIIKGLINKILIYLGQPALLNDENNPDWIPTLNMSRENDDNCLSAMNVQNCYLENASSSIQTCIGINSNVEASTQTSAALFSLNENGSPMKLDMQYISKSPNICKYFTGISSINVIKELFNFVKEDLMFSNKITPDELFVMVLYRMRLNAQLQTIAYQYGISLRTASKHFSTTLFILFKSLKLFVKWPERSILMNHIPPCFRNSTFKSNITVIIDCFEIKIQVPGPMLARCNVFSNYKNAHTVKVLIGVSASGAIIFVSRPYGGRVSDKYVTLNCGLMDFLQPGDHVLADRGFLIKNDVEEKGAVVHLPSFRKAGQQFTNEELTYSQNLATLRVHVERVIGVLRQKYQILHSVVPISMCNKDFNNEETIFQILTVCCALINLNPPII